MEPLGIAREARLPDLIAARAQARRAAAADPGASAATSAAARAVTAAYAAASARSPVLDVFARVDRLVEIVLDPGTLRREGRDEVAELARALAEHVTTTWIVDFDYATVDAAIAAARGQEAPTTLAPAATDVRLVYAPIAVADLVARATARLAAAGFASALETLVALGAAHDAAVAAAPRWGAMGWVLFASKEEEQARRAEHEAREALLTGFEEVEILRFEALGGFLPMRVYVAAAALAGVARHQADLSESQVAPDGSVCGVPSRLGDACIAAAVTRLVEARDAAFPDLAGFLLTGRATAQGDVSPYRRAHATTGDSPAAQAGWLDAAFEEGGAFAIVKRIGAHGALAWDAALEREPDHVSAHVAIAPKDRVVWHRERMTRAVRDLASSIAWATRRTKALTLREYLVVATRLANAMTVIVDRPYGLEEAKQAVSQTLWMLQQTLGPFPTRANFGWLVAQEIQHPGVTLRATTLPSGPLGDAVRGVVRQVATTLGATDFMQRWTQAFEHERDAREALADLETGRRQITFFDRINVFTESRGEAMERLAKSALGAARVEIVRTGKDLAEIVDRALEAHAEAQLVVSFHDVVTRMQSVYATHSNGDRRYMVLVGDEVARAALADWGRRAFAVFGPFPTDGELLDRSVCDRLVRRVEG